MISGLATWYLDNQLASSDHGKMFFFFPVLSTPQFPVLDFLGMRHYECPPFMFTLLLVWSWQHGC